MDKARYLVEAHVVEGRSVGELAATHGVHRSWIYKLLVRYEAGGYGALERRSRAPRSSPNRTPDEITEAKVAKALEGVLHEDLEAWSERPLEAEYSTVSFDVLNVEIGEAPPSQRTCLVALAATGDGGHDLLGIWWGSAESSSSRQQVLGDLQRRGVRDPAAFSAAYAQGPPTEPVEPCAAARKAIERHGSFKDEQAAAALIYLAIGRAEAKRRAPPSGRATPPARRSGGGTRSPKPPPRPH